MRPSAVISIDDPPAVVEDSMRVPIEVREAHVTKANVAATSTKEAEVGRLNWAGQDQKLNAIWRWANVDCDDHLNREEADRLAHKLEGIRPSDDRYFQLCKMLGADPERGITFDQLKKGFYSDAEDVERDFIALGLKEERVAPPPIIVQVAPTSARSGGAPAPTSPPQAKKVLENFLPPTTKLEADLQREVRIENAKLAMTKGACTAWNEDKQAYMWRPLCCTKGSALSAYGVGTRLYFDFLCQMSIMFLILAILAAPALYLNAAGNMLDESNKVYQFLRSLSIANLGTCSGARCRSTEQVRNRYMGGTFIVDGTNKLLKDFAFIYGFLDGLEVFVFMTFGAFFMFFWIPRQVRQTDRKHITASDFAVQLSFLPNRLRKDHDQYGAKLKSHLTALLRESGINDDSAVQEVNLVRNYNGAIRKFMHEGSILSELEEVRAKVATAKALGDTKRAYWTEKAVATLQKKIDASHLSVGDQSCMTDNQREVCFGFVLFNKEEYKDIILHRYRFSRTRLTRCCLPRKLRFANTNIRVDTACEPTDLHWENLDFGKWKRRMRGCITFFVAFVILLVCILCLVGSQSIKYVPAKDRPTRAWVIKNSPSSGSPCLQVCELQFFRSQYCSADSGSSANWTVARIFDATGSSTLGSSRATVVDGAASCSAGRWKSPKCSLVGDGSGQFDWIGIEFAEDRSVKKDVQCMSLHQPSPLLRGGTPPSNELEIFACSKDSLPAAGEYANWRPEEACSSMQDVNPFIGGTCPGCSTVASGNLEISRDTSCRANITYGFVKKLVDTGADPKQDPTLVCFCKSRLLVEGPQFLVPPWNTEQKQLCQKWSEAENSKLGLLFAGVVVVLALNQVLNFAFAYLVEWVRFRTITEVDRHKMTLLLIALFVNTGILMLLVNWAFLGNLPFDLSVLSVIFKGRYFDFDRSFFPNVGSSLCLTIALQTFSNTLPQVFMSYFVTPIMVWSGEKEAVSQRKMNKVYQLPEWNMSYRLAQIMNVIFCIMMYSGAMPALYIVGFFYCAISYWTDKWILLRRSCKPPSYNQDIIQTAVKMWPVIALLHTVVTLWIFGNQNLLPSAWSPLTGFVEDFFNMKRDIATAIVDGFDSDSNSYSRYAQARCLSLARGSSTLLCLIFFAFVVFLLLRLLWRYLLRPFLFPLEAMVVACWRGCCRREQRSSATRIPFEQARQDMEKNQVVSTYTIDANPRYEEATQALKHVDGINGVRRSKV